MDSTPDPEIVAALCRGDKIGAIKLYRERHPESELVEAKRQVEAIERGLPPGSITARRGCGASVLVLAVTAAILWALSLRA